MIKDRLSFPSARLKHAEKFHFDKLDALTKLWGRSGVWFCAGWLEEEWRAVPSYVQKQFPE